MIKFLKYTTNVIAGIGIIVGLFLVGWNIAKIICQNKQDEVIIEEVVTAPTYEELKSHTVLLKRQELMKDESGVEVPTFHSQGTGSVIKVTDDYTYIMTNRHVCNIDAYACYVDIDGENLQLQYVRESETVDLAVWKYFGKLDGKEEIKGVASSIEVTEEVYFVGNYLGFGYIYGEGIVAGRSIDNDLFLQLPAMRGDSGSAIFNKNGEVIGVLYSCNITATTMSFIGSMIDTHVNCIDSDNILLLIGDILNF